jgi:hypothetical protein
MEIVKRRKNLKHKINESFFENIDSKEKAYVLGFICADGYINEFKVVFCLGEEEPLILIQRLLETTMPISKKLVKHPKTRNESFSYVLQLCCKSLGDDLNKIGINNNKSQVCNFPNFLNQELLGHFFRGLFDGDGHINPKKNMVTLLSTKEMLIGLLNYLKIENQNLTEINKSKNLYRKDFYSTSFKFLDFIYKDSEGLRLERKYEKYNKQYKTGKFIC